jgi:hypothetical protein
MALVVIAIHVRNLQIDFEDSGFEGHRELECV